MRTPRLSLPVLAAILACGPADPSDSATAADTTTTSTTTTATGDPTTTVSTTGAATDPTGTTSATTTTTTTTTTATTDTTAGATSTTTGPDTTDTTGDASTGAPDLVEFAARYFPGGLDRLVVRKADYGPGLCINIVFVWPGMVPQGVTLPDQWGVQGAQIGNNIDTCLDLNMPLLPNAVAADGLAGTAGWLAPGCPPTLDIDLTLTFPQEQPWTPPMDVFKAMAIPIDGC
jgi:hypothetical protein